MSLVVLLRVPAALFVLLVSRINWYVEAAKWYVTSQRLARLVPVGCERQMFHTRITMNLRSCKGKCKVCNEHGIACT